MLRKLRSPGLLVAFLAILVVALAAGGATVADSQTSRSEAPLGVQFSIIAYAYSYGDYMEHFTITTTGKAIYNLRMADPSFPGPGVTNLGNVPAHTTVDRPFGGAWYIDGHTILDLPATYQDVSGKTYSTNVLGTYVIQSS